MFAKDGFQSNTVTAVEVPGHKDARDVIARAFSKYNLSLGGGLSEVAGKIFRIGHIGDLNEISILGAIAGVEMSMLDHGFEIQPGSGVGAAIDYFRMTLGK